MATRRRAIHIVSKAVIALRHPIENTRVDVLRNGLHAPIAHYKEHDSGMRTAKAAIAAIFRRYGTEPAEIILSYLVFIPRLSRKQAWIVITVEGVVVFRSVSTGLAAEQCLRSAVCNMLEGRYWLKRCYSPIVGPCFFVLISIHLRNRAIDELLVGLGPVTTIIRPFEVYRFGRICRKWEGMDAARTGHSAIVGN